MTLGAVAGSSFGAIRHRKRERGQPADTTDPADTADPAETTDIAADGESAVVEPTDYHRLVEAARLECPDCPRRRVRGETGGVEHHTGGQFEHRGEL